VPNRGWEADMSDPLYHVLNAADSGVPVSLPHDLAIVNQATVSHEH